MSLIVIGTIAYDTIETAHDRREEVLGGSATYFALAASRYTRPRLVGVVGEDFRDDHRALFGQQGRRRGRHRDRAGQDLPLGRSLRTRLEHAAHDLHRLERARRLRPEGRV